MSNKILKELKQNKYTVIVFCIFLGLFIIGWLVFGLVMPKNTDEKYGTRIDPIKAEYNNDMKKAKQDSDKAENTIVESVKKKDYVTSASAETKGKKIDIVVEVKSNTSAKTARELGDVVLKNTDDKIKKLYDMQLFIKNEKEDAKEFPMKGYKNDKDKNFDF